MAELAGREGFGVLHVEALQYLPELIAFRYRVKSTRDISDQHGNTYVVFAAVSGNMLMSHLPTGKAVGDTITAWITTLHVASIWGMPFRIFVTGLGLAVAMLSVTGVYLWWKKRTARRKSAGR